MSDLGAAWVAVTGTVVGAGVTGWFASRQAKAQERTAKMQYDFERDKLDSERDAAAVAEVVARERAALTAIGEALLKVAQDARGADRADFVEMQRFAYQVHDPVLWELVEDSRFLALELTQRAGYLLRTDPADRTPDGHQTPRTPER